MTRSFEVEANLGTYVYTIVTNITLLDLTLVHAVIRCRVHVLRAHCRVLVLRDRCRVPAVILLVLIVVRFLDHCLHLILVLILDDVFVLINRF